MSDLSSTPFKRVLECIRRSRFAVGDVERIEVDRAQQVTVSVKSAQGDNWFRFIDAQLKPIYPREDALLPLAAEIGEAKDMHNQVEQTDRVALPAATHPAVIAYRPGRRIVLDWRRNQGRQIIKGYRVKRVAGAIQRHRLAAQAANTRDGFGVPAVVESLPEFAAVAFEWVSGEDLDLSSASEDQFFALGVALGEFQGAPLHDALEYFGPQNELDELDRWAEQVQWLSGHLPLYWSQLRSDLDEAIASLQTSNPVLAHRDLHDGQFLVTTKGLVLLDFDLLCKADRELDAGNLLAHLSLRSLQGIRGATDRGALDCGRALLDGLDCQDEGGFWRRLRFYEATSFSRLALVYSLRPRWLSICGSLIKLAQRCTEELEWMD